MRIADETCLLLAPTAKKTKHSAANSQNRAQASGRRTRRKICPLHPPPSSSASRATHPPMVLVNLRPRTARFPNFSFCVASVPRRLAVSTSTFRTPMKANPKEHPRGTCTHARGRMANTEASQRRAKPGPAYGDGPRPASRRIGLFARLHCGRRISDLARACAGRLVPQDPNDEPAEKLFHRIRAAAGASEVSVSTASKTKKKVPIL